MTKLINVDTKINKDYISEETQQTLSEVEDMKKNQNNCPSNYNREDLKKSLLSEK